MTRSVSILRVTAVTLILVAALVVLHCPEVGCIGCPDDPVASKQANPAVQPAVPGLFSFAKVAADPAVDTLPGTWRPDVSTDLSTLCSRLLI